VDEEATRGATLERELHEARAAHEDVAQTLVRETGRADGLAADLEQVRVALAAAESNAAALQGERSALEERLAQRAAAVENADDETRRQREEIQRLTAELTAAAERLALAERELEGLKEQSGEAAAAAASRATELRAQLDAASTELESLREESAAHECRAAALDEELGALRTGRDEAERRVADLEAAFEGERLGLAESHRAELEGVRAELEAARAAAEQTASERAALEQELAQRAAEADAAGGLAERTRTEAGDRIEALEGEVNRLQERNDELAGERTRLESELAEQAASNAVADLEQQLEDVRAEHAAELERGVAAEAALRDELVAAEQARDAALARAESAAAADVQLADLEAELADRIGERDAAREEARELRAVMEQYVEQIRSARGDVDVDSEAVVTELRMVREQATRDLTHLRSELDKARERIRDLEQVGGHDPLNAEALRQEVASLRDSLAERQRELAEAERNRQRVEDQLEDAAREIERLRQDNFFALSELSSEHEILATPSNGRRRAGQLDPADEIDEIVNGGLRDERIKPPRRAVNADRVGSRSRASLVFGLIVGLVLVVGGLELAMMLTGRGELFLTLFRPGG
jgi:chromosome segregation ATPase